VDLPFLARSGLNMATARGEKWHLYTIVLEDSIVQAAQRASERESLASSNASALIVPALAMLAAMAGLLTLALRRALSPLSHAAGEVTTRSVEALDPIPLDSHPPELHLLVSAINDLMARLGSALALQRQFLADAAHELRTPIAALRLQLQLLERAGSAAQREDALNELRAGIARAQHLVEQLLQLSRLGPEAPSLQRQPVALPELVRSAVAHFSARAEQQGIDLGAIADTSPLVEADYQQLTILVNTLIDNALRHAPAGGKVDVLACRHNGTACLRVSDTGPGIPAAERERVFDRFYRTPGTPVPGSGLGLAIVKAVADRHGATVTLEDAPRGGLQVTVSFPQR
jgi:signal transduction histidine kinase